MEITWYGRACFRLKGREATVITDPCPPSTGFVAGKHDVDLLTISPLDRETLVTSVQKTGRAVIVHEAPRSFGPGAEIATSIMDGAFLSLEAPIARVTSWDVPFPGFAREKGNVPDLARVLAAARETLAF